MAWQERFSLTGKKAIVTGATKGIGLEIAKLFAEAGADIAAVGRDEAGLAETATVIGSKGRRAVAINADLSTKDGPRIAGERALEALGGVDILVNNAGIALIDDLVEQSIEDWDQTMAVNLRAPFVLARTIAPAMIAQNSGKIINVSSQAGSIALQGHGAYCASKGALNMLTKVMTCEWSKHNIQVTAVSPTIILTPMGEQVWGDPAKGQPMLDKTPLGRFGKPIEVADLVMFLASDASNLITGENILIDGGFTSM